MRPLLVPGLPPPCPTALVSPTPHPFAHLCSPFHSFVLDAPPPCLLIALTRPTRLTLLHPTPHSPISHSPPLTSQGNLRLITEDAGLSEALWARIKDFLPHRVRAPHVGDPTAFGPSTEREWEAVGLNECWRLAKYFPEDQFMGHVDAEYARSYDEMSMFTVNIYMNDVAAEHGGATRFYEDDEDDNEVRRRGRERERVRE